MLIEGAEQCSPSLFERLNGVLDGEQELLLPECFDQDNQLRKVSVHADFRVFLLFPPDAEHKISSALRNRCVIFDWPASGGAQGRGVDYLQILKTMHFLKEVGLPLDFGKYLKQFYFSDEFLADLVCLRNQVVLNPHFSRLFIAEFERKSDSVMEVEDTYPATNASIVEHFAQRKLLQYFSEDRSSRVSVLDKYHHLVVHLHHFFSQLESHRPHKTADLSQTVSSLEVRGISHLLGHWILSFTNIVKFPLLVGVFDRRRFAFQDDCFPLLQAYFAPQTLPKLQLLKKQNPAAVSKFLRSVDLVKDFTLRKAQSATPA